MKESMGQIIRRLRKAAGLTQDRLAELLSVSSQAVSKWETDSAMPDISQVVPLATVLGGRPTSSSGWLSRVPTGRFGSVKGISAV